MIAFLVLCYVGILYVLMRVGVIPRTLGWKLSPVFWFLLLLIVLFIPMQWGAPSGPLTVYQYTVEIIPNVSGEVVEVPVETLQWLEKGEVLFRIDPIPYQAAVDDLESQLSLARIRLKDAIALESAGASAKARAEKHQADVLALTARLTRAQYDLAETVVRAPSDGRVIAMTLVPGTRVSNMPFRSWMAFVVQSKFPVLLIPQYLIRHVQVGQEAEVVLRALPGRTLRAKVKGMAPIIGQGQILPNGSLPRLTGAEPAEPFPVLLEFEDLAGAEAEMRGGTVGTGAIYTGSVPATHLIRRVMIRMEGWLNYLRP